jgi:hypothetical protein
MYLYLNTGYVSVFILLLDSSTHEGVYSYLKVNLVCQSIIHMVGQALGTEKETKWTHNKDDKMNHTKYSIYTEAMAEEVQYLSSKLKALSSNLNTTKTKN